MSVRLCDLNDTNNGMDLGYRVVMQLMCGYMSSNRCVFADNYFTTVHLATTGGSKANVVDVQTLRTEICDSAL